MHPIVFFVGCTRVQDYNGMNCRNYNFNQINEFDCKKLTPAEVSTVPRMAALIPIVCNFITKNQAKNIQMQPNNHKFVYLLVNSQH